MAHAPKEKEKFEREKIVGRRMTVGKKEGKEGWEEARLGSKRTVGKKKIVGEKGQLGE